MSPIRFYLSVTLGLQLLNTNDVDATNATKHQAVHNWIEKMTDALVDLRYIQEQGDAFDEDLRKAFDALEDVWKHSTVNLDSAQTVQINQLLQGFSTLLSQWQTKEEEHQKNSERSNPHDSNDDTALLKHLLLQHNQLLISKSQTQHIYDMPEVALELISRFHAMTKGFTRVLDVDELYLNIDELLTFATIAIEGLVEQMHIEYQLPHRAELLLQARLQLLIAEIRLFAHFFTVVDCGSVNGEEVLLVTASKLESGLRTRMLLNKPRLSLVKRS